MKNIILFVSGLVIGAGIAYAVCKKKFDKAVAELEEYYKEVDKYRRVKHEDEVEEERPPVLSKEDRDAIREKQKENRKLDEEKINYAGMYRTKNGYTENVLAEGEYPREDGDSSIITEEQQAHEEHQMNKDKPPRIISADSLGELPPYIDHKVLYFYALDETLVSDEDEVLDNVEYFIGDALTKYNFIDNDEVLIFVLNYSLDTCYEIQKVLSAYGDES